MQKVKITKDKELTELASKIGMALDTFVMRVGILISRKQADKFGETAKDLMRLASEGVPKIKVS